MPLTDDTMALRQFNRIGRGPFKDLFDFRARRLFNTDPLADKYVYNSPYAFSENKMGAHVELEGLEIG